MFRGALEAARGEARPPRRDRMSSFIPMNHKRKEGEKKTKKDEEVALSSPKLAWNFAMRTSSAATRHLTRTVIQTQRHRHARKGEC